MPARLLAMFVVLVAMFAVLVAMFAVLAAMEAEFVDMLAKRAPPSVAKFPLPSVVTTSRGPD
jgi:hypothetical protein